LKSASGVKQDEAQLGSCDVVFAADFVAVGLVEEGIEQNLAISFGER
jgi:hypothetical protein